MSHTFTNYRDFKKKGESLMTEFDLTRQGEERYTIDDFLAVIRRLLGPDGCPWDRVQSHISLRQNMIEEAYETVDAIDSGVPDRIKDELGDVLLQVVFHAALEERDGGFAFTDVTDTISRKLISRHSHVFGKDEAESPDAVISVWDKNKMIEKGHTTFTQTLQDVPCGLPALMRSEKLQKRAAKAGFDWPDAKGARDKITEELIEIEDALSHGAMPIYGKLDEGRDKDVFSAVEGEMGDLLFAVVNYARLLGISPEVALNRANGKFIRRFKAVEDMAQEQGKDLMHMSLPEMDLLWDTIKLTEKGEPNK
jgi:tetrapyrrole methylase family protein/MazG family protein